jgi:hypothetical protein
VHPVRDAVQRLDGDLCAMHRRFGLS